MHAHGEKFAREAKIIKAKKCLSRVAQNLPFSSAISFRVRWILVTKYNNGFTCERNQLTIFPSSSSENRERDYYKSMKHFNLRAASKLKSSNFFTFTHLNAKI